ncbi:MAG: DUF2254 domain-containing protein [Candidatus Devosia phytovorans]|uniref:DUF2254 domain-containing protein n=1 Tax=Candidatus Devosia phytovorans TaxID=3121372 RepID=A0AAJ5VRL8_9HYPH|nr:DUF2254 domain-containing protein [Devosia sp.]WEK03374.1 MAG: DUF2254 domain-containing protein [Devosia sp.]
MTRWRWLLLQISRRLWVRATLIGLIGVAAAILAAVVEKYVPWEMPASIDAAAVDGLLNIIATSMLAVTTFSLSVMTSAYGAATSNVTPRATKLVMEDRVTQNVLSTFIGTFLFGIVGIIVLRVGAYGDRGRVILFGVTILVIVLIVVTLLRWIDHLTRLGRVGETTTRVEEATRAAIEERITSPYLGGVPLPDGETRPSEGASVVLPDAIGYVQHIDVAALNRIAEGIESKIRIVLNPGAFVYADTVLAWFDAKNGPDTEHKKAIRQAFTIAAERSFDQDPRFGLAVMSEIASRALSPATNDPGTAIDVIGRTTRLMSIWADRPEKADDPEYLSVMVAPLSDSDLFEDAFMLVARDGAGLIEVQMRLQKSLLALGRIGGKAFRMAARSQAELAMDRARRALTNDFDRAKLADLVGQESSQDR